jgi:chitinase
MHLSFLGLKRICHPDRSVLPRCWVRHLIIPWRQEIKFKVFSLLCLIFAQLAHTQTAPKFTQGPYTVFGQHPAHSGTTVIPTVLVPVDLAFPGQTIAARADVPLVLGSPVFSNFAFASGTTQYADAMMRSSFPHAAGHTLLDKPEVRPITVRIPVGYGYILTSKKSGRSLAVVDVQFLQKAIFQQIPKQQGKLVIAFAENTTTYTSGDATECCAWGTHGVDEATGNSFVLSSYLRDAPSVVKDQDIQPLTQQLAEFINDPLHDPLFHGHHHQPRPGNHFPNWMRLPFVSAGDQGPCGGSMVATDLFLLEPTDTSAKNEIPASEPFVAGDYHLQNAALLPWYISGTQPYSFPDAHVLTSPAVHCPPEQELSSAPPKVAAIPSSNPSGPHKLIGYWEGYDNAEATFPLRDISSQWDVIIVAFATPAKNAPEGTMQFHPPVGMDPAQFKADVKYLQSQGKKVMVSLGGGGEHFTLADPKRVPNYVATVTEIVRDYGFDGVDIDFESPSLSLDPGDTDFRKPTTPSVVHLISALRQLHDHFGPAFMISLVPEGTQIPAGYPSYGGQFGSYLAITWAIRDILSFIDVQDYNTPPLQGLDGEIYQPGSVDYHAAMTELLLHGFNVGGDPSHFFPPLPADKVAVGFLTPDTTPAIVSQAMEYLITGKAPAGAEYRLRNPSGYPRTLGAMFWTLNDDRRNDYNYSNTVGPLLHRLTGENR